MSALASVNKLPPQARIRAWNALIDVILLLVSIGMILPLVLLVANAFKSPQELLQWPPSIFPRAPTLDNLKGVIAETPLLRWVMNSFLFAVLSTAAIVATSAVSVLRGALSSRGLGPRTRRSPRRFPRDTRPRSAVIWAEARSDPLGRERKHHG